MSKFKREKERELQQVLEKGNVDSLQGKERILGKKGVAQGRTCLELLETCN